MPILDGFALLARTRGIDLPAVVFVTAHEEHAVRAFGIRALDYLLKPVDQDRLHETIERARDHLTRMSKGELADRMLGVLRPGGHEATGHSATKASHVVRIPVRKDGNIQFVAAEEIDWIDAAGDSVRLHAGKSTHVVRKSMGEILAMLDPAQFLRIHRSTIVNVERVRELQPYFHGEYMVVLRDDTKLKLSRGYRDDLSRVLGLRS
jgi:two-component system LytT family response regulator